jgi:hypothetical protein
LKKLGAFIIFRLKRIMSHNGREMPECQVGALRFFVGKTVRIDDRFDDAFATSTQKSVIRERWAQQDSNLQPRHYECPALTIEL